MTRASTCCVPATRPPAALIKGEANYYSLRAGGREHRDIAWYYRFPLPEVRTIANYLCFYNERVEALIVDGVTVARRGAA